MTVPAGDMHLFSIAMMVTDDETGETHQQVLSSVNVPCQRPIPTLADWSTSQLASELDRRLRPWIDEARTLPFTDPYED